MTIDELVDRMAKPVFVLRMARAMEENRWASKPQRKGAEKRAEKARTEIRDLIDDFVVSHPNAYPIGHVHG